MKIEINRLSDSLRQILNDSVNEHSLACIHRQADIQTDMDQLQIVIT